jgi:hypothetical protein
MSRIVPVAFATHATKSWWGVEDYRFASNDIFTAIGVSEVANVTLSMPIGFLKDGPNILPVALMGVVAGKNEFVSIDGKWKGPYIPFRIRTYPFCLAKNSEKNDELILCFDESGSSLENSRAGNPFFYSDGGLHKTVKKIFDALVLFQKEQLTAKYISNELETMGLLVPWTIKFETLAGPKELVGLYRVDEAALEALEDTRFQSLRRSGALAIAYCQMLSVHHVPTLIEKAQNHPAQHHLQATVPMELDFSSFSR